MTIRAIIDWLKENGYEFYFMGDETTPISGFASLSNYHTEKITWIKKKENYDENIVDVTVSCAVVQEGIDIDVPNQIISKNSKEVFFAILHHFWGSSYKEGFVGEGTIIAEGAQVDPTAYIGYNCSLIGNVRIGAHTVIENNVVISGNVFIGENCHIQSSVVIGIDGFGYSKDADSGKKKMIEHFGGVRIGNDVFISSHVNISRGTIDDTVICDGVKIAPSSHIGHNNYVGENVTIICSNLFGSVKIGKDTYIVSSTVQNQKEIGEHSVIGMGSTVTKNIPDDVIAFGSPAKVIKTNNSDL